VLAGRGGGGAAARPLGRSFAPLQFLLSGHDENEAQQAAAARARDPNQTPANDNNTSTQALLARRLCALLPGLAGCLDAAGGMVVVSVTIFTLRFSPPPPPFFIYITLV